MEKNFTTQFYSHFNKSRRWKSRPVGTRKRKDEVKKEAFLIVKMMIVLAYPVVAAKQLEEVRDYLRVKSRLQH